MNTATFPTLVALALQLALGFVVLQSNRHRKPNQCFLVLSLAICAWLITLYFAFTARSVRAAELSIRAASATAPLIFLAFTLLRISIREQRRSWGELLGRSKWWVFATLVIIVLCQTKFFLADVHFGGTVGSKPTPVYGPVFPLYLASYVAAILLLVLSTIRDIRAATGGDRAELSFILIAGILALTVSLPLTFLLGFIIDPSRLISLAPFRVVVFSTIIAYGIATKKVMEVGVLLRRIISYALLAAYLLGVYALVWWLVATALQSSTANAH